jgi:hypothetical protein
MTHILAPVPALHLPSAETVFARQGVVAFGSDAWEFWQKALVGSRVWIVASATDFPSAGLPGIDPGKLIFSARLAAITLADRRHRHPNPDLRPASTEADGNWTLFFEVDDLTRLAPPLSVIGVRTVQGVGLQRVPHGPLNIRDPQVQP